MGDTQKAGITVAGLKERLGVVFDEIFALGRQIGRDEGYKEGLAEGARVERDRVQAALAQPLPGTEARSGAQTGPGGPRAAEPAPKAQAPSPDAPKAGAPKKPKASGFLSKIKEVAGRQPLPATGDGGEQRAAGSGVPIEERCRAEWERDFELRAEFGTLEAYTEFTRQREAGIVGRS